MRRRPRPHLDIWTPEPTGGGWGQRCQPEGTIFRLRFYDAFVPLIASAVAIFPIWLYPITEQRALRVREELERRRGVGAGQGGSVTDSPHR